MNGIQKTPPGKNTFDFVLYQLDVRNVELARKTGISDTEISRYRRGLVPSPERRKKIAKVLKLSQAELGWGDHA